MLAAILLAPLLHHVTSEDDSTTTYVGCFSTTGGREGDSIPTQEGERFTSSTDDVFNSCKDMAHSREYSTFAIYDQHNSCYTSYNLFNTFADYGEDEVGCSDERGGENAMFVYQIVGHKKEEFNWNDIIKCEQESETMNELIMIFDANLSFGLGPTYENVTKYVRDTCDASKECTLYYDDMFSSDPPTKLTVTYGCLYSGLKDKDETDTGFQGLGQVVFLFLLAAALLCAWFRRREIIRQYPDARRFCWAMHTACPDLKLYPSDATHQDYGNERVVVNPSHASYSDNDAYPHSPRTVTHQPVSFSANPAEPPTYPPPVGIANIPYQPPSNDLPPPPTYDAATTGPSRTSGGWFSKLAQ